jgi:hypothetical protein
VYVSLLRIFGGVANFGQERIIVMNWWLGFGEHDLYQLVLHGGMYL